MRPTRVSLSVSTTTSTRCTTCAGLSDGDDEVEPGLVDGLALGGEDLHHERLQGFAREGASASIDHVDRAGLLHLGAHPKTASTASSMPRGVPWTALQRHGLA